MRMKKHKNKEDLEDAFYRAFLLSRANIGWQKPTFRQRRSCDDISNCDIIVFWDFLYSAILRYCDSDVPCTRILSDIKIDILHFPY